MKYLKYMLVCGIVFITATSYTTTTSRISEGINPGNLSPDFVISDELGNDFKLSDMKGQKILVNFWAAYDANSHLNNVRLSNVLKREKDPVKMVSISFDQSKSVFTKTLSMDGIDPNLQFLDTRSSNSDIYKKYRLEKGFKNILIDENGVILAINIAPENLSKTLKEN